MSTHPSTQRRYIIYDHHMEHMKEVVLREGDRLTNELKQVLNRSVLFLQYENTYYYRDIAFLKLN